MPRNRLQQSRGGHALAQEGHVTPHGYVDPIVLVGVLDPRDQQSPRVTG